LSRTADRVIVMIRDGHARSEPLERAVGCRRGLVVGLGLERVSARDLGVVLDRSPAWADIALGLVVSPPC